MPARCRFPMWPCFPSKLESHQNVSLSFCKEITQLPKLPLFCFKLYVLISFHIANLIESILLLENEKQSSTFFRRKFNLMLQRITKFPASESCMQPAKYPLYFRPFRKSLLSKREQQYSLRHSCGHGDKLSLAISSKLTTTALSLAHSRCYR